MHNAIATCEVHVILGIVTNIIMIIIRMIKVIAYA